MLGDIKIFLKEKNNINHLEMPRTPSKIQDFAIQPGNRKSVKTTSKISHGNWNFAFYFYHHLRLDKQRHCES
jgi:hypothetical protein